MGIGDMKAALGVGLGKSANARMVAVCDPDTMRTANAKEIIEAFHQERNLGSADVKEYSDFRELLARDDIDGVLISTPDHWHGLMGIAAAKAGKHIYLQKPLTYDIRDGQALVKAVRSNQVVLQTGSQQRSSVYFRQICTIIRNNWLGELKRIEVEVPTDQGRADGEPTDPPPNLDYDLWLGPCPEVPYVESRVHPQRGYSRPGWLQVERHCRGMITGWGAHMYDIAQWAMGADEDSGPVEISAKGDFPDRGRFNVHVGYEGEARYANGVVLTSRNGSPGVKFITGNGWATCKRGGMDCSDKDLLRRKPADGEVALYHSRNHMGDFMTSARAGKDPICPVEVGHRSNSVCVLHHISMKLDGRAIKWVPAKETAVGDEEVTAMLDTPMREPWSL